MSKSIAVLGLGRFGKKLALGLYENGVDVMAVDRDQKLIDSISDKVTYALVADFSNAESIKGIGLEEMDTVVVAMGSDLTASIMAVMISKELGVPYVMAKASDERMGAILTKVGADEVIYPEEEMGERTARILVFDSFLEFFEIDDLLLTLLRHLYLNLIKAALKILVQLRFVDILYLADNTDRFFFLFSNLTICNGHSRKVTSQFELWFSNHRQETCNKTHTSYASIVSR